MKPLFFILMTIISYNCLAQLDDNTKAKLYFIEAERYFNQNDYRQAVEYIEKAEQELGNPNARTLNLKIKAYYNDGKFKKAETALNLFINEYQNYATEEIKNEILSYFVRIEKAVEEQKKEEFRIAEEQRRKKEEPERMKKILSNYGKSEEYKIYDKKMIDVYADWHGINNQFTFYSSETIYLVNMQWRYIERFYKVEKEGQFYIYLDLEEGYANNNRLKEPGGEYERYDRKRYKKWSYVFFNKKDRDEFYKAFNYFFNIHKD